MVLPVAPENISKDPKVSSQARTAVVISQSDFNYRESRKLGGGGEPLKMMGLKAKWLLPLIVFSISFVSYAPVSVAAHYFFGMVKEGSWHCTANPNPLWYGCNGMVHVDKR